MSKNKSATAAAGALSPRADEAEEDFTELVTPAHDLHEEVDGVDPSETPQDFSGGYRSIHDADDQSIHGSAEEDFGQYDDDDMHIDIIEGFEVAKNLTAPKPREGYAYCWVNKNPKEFRIMRKRGYTLVDPATVPAEFRAFNGDQGQGGGDFVEAAGMVLMEIPLKLQQRNTRGEEAMSRRFQEASSNEVKKANQEGQRMNARPIYGSMERQTT